MEINTKIKPGDIVTLEYARLYPKSQAPLFIVLNGPAESPKDLCVYCYYCGEPQFNWAGKRWEIEKERLRIINY